MASKSWCRTSKWTNLTFINKRPLAYVKGFFYVCIMNQNNLKDIDKTLGGLIVKGLVFKPVDNIIIGFVKDPLFGKPSLHDGFICCQWSAKGLPIKLNKGRKELEINLEMSK